MPETKEKKKRDIPQYVRDKVEYFENEGYDVGYAYPLAWSIYCRYKRPDSPHCKMKKNDYFKEQYAEWARKRKMKKKQQKKAGYHKNLLIDQVQELGEKLVLVGLNEVIVEYISEILMSYDKSHYHKALTLAKRNKRAYDLVLDFIESQPDYLGF